MRGSYRDALDIRPYLERLPDKGRCLTNGGSVAYLTSDPETLKSQDRPFLQGIIGAPTICSTDTTVELRSRARIIWDANKYYRDLGFAFPFTPTRKQLRLAYFDHDGLDDVRLTTVMKFLLNPKLRSAYDATPLGELYLDEDLQTFFKRRAAEEARKRGGDATAEEVLAEWGLDAVPVKPSEEDVESEGETRYGEDPDEPEDPATSDSPESSDPPAKITSWDWSYFVWRTVQDDRPRLAAWQEFLVSMFVERSILEHFAVGFIDEARGPYAVAKVDSVYVFFLGEDAEPTAELAMLAVFEFLYNRNRWLFFDSNYRQVTPGALSAKFRQGW